MDKYCKDCQYRAADTRGIHSCEYILVTGHRRGCPPGALCTKKERGKRIGEKSIQRNGGEEEHDQV